MSDLLPHLGAVVLCGGQSRRMGQSKAHLPFGDTTLLARVLERIGSVVEQVVVVAAPAQTVPPLPSSVTLLRDPSSDRGPLQGISVGLANLHDQVEHAFVSSTDAPFLAPSFIARLNALRTSDYDIVVPEADGHLHPLAAIYATRLHTAAQALLDDGRHRPIFLFEQARTRRVGREELLDDPQFRQRDPQLHSLMNINTPADYADALALAARAPKA